MYSNNTACWPVVPVIVLGRSSCPAGAPHPHASTLPRSSAQAAAPAGTLPGVPAHPATPGGEADRGSGSAGAAAALSAGAAARLYGGADAGGGGGDEPQQLQRRLEALLREAAGGAAVGGEDKVKVRVGTCVTAAYFLHLQWSW